MTKLATPLRYPGGKSCLYEVVSEILRLNRLERGEYAEPFAGGCGLALRLLFGGLVSDIHLNDIDAGIWSFWHSVLNESDDLVDRVLHTPVTVDEWQRQREIEKAQDIADPVSLGFATFFLNRTNRSGIIKGAGVIGGMQQKGNYKIDCRFNREALSQRIHRIAKYKGRIHLTRLDALEFIRNENAQIPESAFFCIDPPYFNKGSSLYTSFYKPDDHSELSDAVTGLKNPWVVTYDDVDQIRRLYQHRRQFSFDINYSVQTKRVGTELLIASKRLKLPEAVRMRQVDRVRNVKSSEKAASERG